MGDFLGFLSTQLDELSEHSTGIGNVWRTVLFVFRVMVLHGGAEKVWDDEHTSLVCNSDQPGCEQVCFDWQFPISHIRLWVLQIIVVSTPTLLYLGHAMYISSKETKLRERLKRNEDNVKLPKYTDDKGHVVNFKGKVRGSYITHLVIKILLEIGFIVGQYYLYGFIMVPMFTCSQSPCPLIVRCYMSRPTEKTIFIIFMLAMSCVSLLLSVIDIFYLLCSRGLGHTKPTSRTDKSALISLSQSGTHRQSTYV
ncbi:gap junction Cx32.2 protein-like [Sardina pilchardus]|uniref:gap junction Cx32.2 protein-like n=1 Tax=Sardina pilchardus TaxID=27697 RepID=UPI002E113CC0